MGAFTSTSANNEETKQCPNVNLVLLGKTGAGKSSSGNTILGRKEFKAEFSARSITKECQVGKTEIEGRQVTVLDTPGLFDTKLFQEAIETETVKVKDILGQGSCALLIIIELGRFTEEQKRTVEMIEKLCGEQVREKCIILFTMGDKLQGMTIEDFIQESGADLQEVVERYGRRYHVFNNNDHGNRSQVVELLNKVHTMILQKEEHDDPAKQTAHLEPDREHDDPAKQKEHLEPDRERDDPAKQTAHLEPDRERDDPAKQTEHLEADPEPAAGKEKTFEENDRQLQPSTLSTLGEEGSNSEVSPAKEPLSSFSELRIVLLGKKGAGKSASGNTILGFEGFKVEASSSSGRSEFEKKKGEVFGRSVVVIDTPDLFDPQLSNEESLKMILKCVCLSLPGPHCFLLTVQVHQFTKEEREAVEKILRVMGEKNSSHTIMLFTHFDELRTDQKIEDYIESSEDDELKALIRNCGSRYHAFNNKNTPSHNQVAQLLEKIDAVIEMNGGKYYTSDMYEETQQALKREEERMQKEKEEMIDRVVKELLPKYRHLIDEACKSGQQNTSGSCSVQ